MSRTAPIEDDPKYSTQSDEQELDSYSFATKELKADDTTYLEYSNDGMCNAISNDDLSGVRIIADNKKVTIDFNAAAFHALKEEKWKILNFLIGNYKSIISLEQLNDLGLQAVKQPQDKSSLITHIVKLLLVEIYTDYFFIGVPSRDKAKDFDDREKSAVFILIELLKLNKINVADAVHNEIFKLDLSKDKPRVRTVLSYTLKNLVTEGIYEQLTWIDKKNKLNVLIDIIQRDNSEKILFVAILNNTHDDADRCLQTISQLVTLGCSPHEKFKGQTLEASFKNKFPKAEKELQDLNKIIASVPKQKSVIEEFTESVSNFFGKR